jgi:hypothetical protein
MPRPMTPELETALDSLTVSERLTVVLQAAQLRGDVAFERLIRALAAEVDVLDARDAALLDGLDLGGPDAG